MAFALYPLLILISFLCCYSCSISSTFLTLLVLVLSTSSPFVFSKIKQLRKGGSMEETPEPNVGPEMLPEDEDVKDNKASQDEGDKFQTDRLVLGSLEHEGLEWLESNLPAPENKCRLLDSSIANEKLLPGPIPSASSDSSASDDKSSPENVRWLMGSSEGSISDDESLIEIALPDGHYVGGPEALNALCQRDFRGGFLPDYMPESVFRQHGLMELLSEISEEDNLIEIDIAMGSIKCSRFEIKA